MDDKLTSPGDHPNVEWEKQPHVKTFRFKIVQIVSLSNFVFLPHSHLNNSVLSISPQGHEILKDIAIKMCNINLQGNLDKGE